MTSARRLYRVGAGIAALGIASAGLGLVNALRALEFGLPSPGALAAACGQLLVPDVGVGGMLVLALAGFGALALLLGGRSLHRQLRAHRRFMATLSPRRSLLVAGTPVTVIEGETPRAFCAGFLRPRVYLSTGAVALLPDAHLEAVAAHERHHLRRRDPLRILCARVVRDALFFVPILRRLEQRYGALAEIAADEAVVRERGPRTLASAFLAFADSRVPAGAVGIAPERVDNLLGRRPGWELSPSLLAGSVAAVSGLLAGAVATDALVANSSLNAAMLLMQSCTLAMVGLLVIAAWATLLSAGRLRRVA